MLLAPIASDIWRCSCPWTEFIGEREFREYCHNGMTFQTWEWHMSTIIIPICTKTISLLIIVYKLNFEFILWFPKLYQITILYSHWQVQNEFVRRYNCNLRMFSKFSGPFVTLYKLNVQCTCTSSTFVQNENHFYHRQNFWIRKPRFQRFWKLFE